MTPPEPDAPTFSFPPLQRRTVILGLTAGPVASLAVGGVVAVAALAALPEPLGAAGAAGTIAAAVVAGFWPVSGDPPARWVPLVAGWLARRRVGAVALDPGVTAGVSVALGSGAPIRGGAARSSPGRRAAATAPWGVSIGALAASPGDESMAAVNDRRHGRIMAVIPVEGPSLTLLDPPAAGAVVGGWGRLLAAAARAGSGVRRLQWVHHVMPADLTSLRHLAHGATGPADAVESYRALVGSEVGWATAQRSLLVCAVDSRLLRSARLGGKAVPAEVLRREVRLLRGQLRAAGFVAGPVLDADAVIAAIAAATGPCGAPPGSPWPTARRESWSSLRVDGSWVQTFWVAGWPQLAVGPDALAPLLTASTGSWRSVAMTMAPVAPERAVREVQSARTASLADEALRARAGFITTARRTRDAEAVAAREAELAVGHGELRFAAYVTVGAPDRAGLDAAAAEVIHAAAAAGLVLRLLHGRQAEAATYTLPLARGVE